MRAIIEEDELKLLWKKLDDFCEFDRRMKEDRYDALFCFKEEYKRFKINKFWGEEEEKLMNDIIKCMGDDILYAIDYYHECFEYNPQIDNTYKVMWYDADRNVNVYFPSYFPNGDYYFFVAKDFSYGLFGVPFKNELYVTNKKLISLISEKANVLGLSKIWE